MINGKSGIKQGGSGRAERRRLAFSLAAILTVVGGCEGLLDVSLPGDLTDADLSDPRLANTLVLSTQGEFECAFASYVWSMGLWAGDFHTSGNLRTNVLVANRLADAWKQVTPIETECTNSNPPPLWLPLQIAREVAEDAIERFQAYPEGAVSNSDYLIAKASLYAAYSRQLLSETFCEITFEAGPILTRAQGFESAVERFTQAIEHAERITSGPHAEEARYILNAAHVGRARAKLNLGDAAGVVADASQVEEGFVANVTRSETDPRRWNHLQNQTHIVKGITVTESYRDLTVDGVPDPRVVVTHEGFGQDGATPLWVQHKMPTRDAPMPFASWREAQLMIAEVEGGQTAVDIINRLRDTYDLPHFSSTDPDAIRAQVIEERRRELWLHGTRLGDMLRLGLPFLTGVDPRGGPYGDGTCLPFPVIEEIGNPNF